MSPAIARQLEQELEEKGTLRLSKKKAVALFDYRAKKLLGMSGTDALKRIRKGKRGKNLAWDELTVFSALL